MKKQAVLEALLCAKITHHTPGRLRLDVAARVREIEGLAEEDLRKIFDAPGVKECKINRLLGKITLLYDAAAIAPEALEALLAARDEAALDAALAALGVAL